MDPQASRKEELPGKRESGPKARRINDQPGADSRHSRGYSLQPSDGAWHLRGASTGGRKRNPKKKGGEEGKHDGANEGKKGSGREGEREMRY